MMMEALGGGLLALGAIFIGKSIRDDTERGMLLAPVGIAMWSLAAVVLFGALRLALRLS